MSTQDGDPHPFAAPTAVRGTRLRGGLLLAGTMVLLVVAVMTFPVPGIPSLSEMDKATAPAPRVTVACRTTWAGDIPSETCYWTLRLDDGKELSWPWPKPKDSSGQVREYLRANGPITVHFWNGMLYQIELHDGEVYLGYGDVYDSETEKQWIGVILGFFVAVMSLLRIVLELRHRRDPQTATRAEELGAYLGIFCLGGALLVAAFGWPRMWVGVIGLALFAALAPCTARTPCAEHRRALHP